MDEISVLFKALCVSCLLKSETSPLFFFSISSSSQLFVLIFPERCLGNCRGSDVYHFFPEKYQKKKILLGQNKILPPFWSILLFPCVYEEIPFQKPGVLCQCIFIYISQSHIDFSRVTFWGSFSAKFHVLQHSLRNRTDFLFFPWSSLLHSLLWVSETNDPSNHERAVNDGITIYYSVTQKIRELEFWHKWAYLKGLF